MPLIRYLRRHPFSVMALCNIIGDLGYLGFAFAAQGLVSGPKLTGALFTMAAHVILLAHGDDQALRIAHEHGVASRAVLQLRGFAQRLFMLLPQWLRSAIQAKPIGISFAMLSMNGAGLLIDALEHAGSLASISQTLVGVFILLGCGAFALADFVPQQKGADMLLKIAPSLLLIATLTNAALVFATHNVFLFISLIVFLLSNLTGFFTRIDKTGSIFPTTG